MSSCFTELSFRKLLSRFEDIEKYSDEAYQNYLEVSEKLFKARIKTIFDKFNIALKNIPLLPKDWFISRIKVSLVSSSTKKERIENILEYSFYFNANRVLADCLEIFFRNSSKDSSFSDLFFKIFYLGYQTENEWNFNFFVPFFFVLLANENNVLLLEEKKLNDEFYRNFGDWLSNICFRKDLFQSVAEKNDKNPSKISIKAIFVFLQARNLLTAFLNFYRPNSTNYRLMLLRRLIESDDVKAMKVLLAEKAIETKISVPSPDLYSSSYEKVVVQGIDVLKKIFHPFDFIRSPKVSTFLLKQYDLKKEICVELVFSSNFFPGFQKIQYIFEFDHINFPKALEEALKINTFNLEDAENFLALLEKRKETSIYKAEIEKAQKELKTHYFPILNIPNFDSFSDSVLL